jgi:hypothetical protein
MFSFLRKSQPRPPSSAMAQALITSGLPSGMQPSSLEVVTQHGSYSGRGVSFFRVYDPVRVEERELKVRHFADLDAHPDLVLGSGHVESDGAVVLSRRGGSQVASTPTRNGADRSAHADDEQIVFPGRGAT